MTDASSIDNKEVNEEKKDLNEADQALLKAKNDFQKDMHRYKEAAKSAESELQALKEEKATIERAQLEKNEEWKVLYEREQSAKAEALTNLESKSKQFVDSSKVNAVVQQLGGFKKEEYVRFIDPKKIAINETGAIDEASLKEECERIRQTFPELLKGSKTADLPDGAPTTVKQTNKDLSMLSPAELKALYSKTKNKSK